MSGTQSTDAAEVRDIVAALAARAVRPYRGQVFRARAYPLKVTSFPALLVYGYDETLSFVSLDSSDLQGTNVCQMVVQILVKEASPEAAELALEILTGAVRSQVLQSHRLLGECGAIERVRSVKTTRSVKAESDDVLGEALIVFEMQWSEVYWLREVPIDDISVEISMFCNPIIAIDIPLDPPTPVPDPCDCGPVPPPECDFPDETP